MKVRSVRHGEVWLLPVNSLPKGKHAKSKRQIVGHSETGHHHVLESRTEFEVTETQKHELYLQLFKPAKLVHQKTVNRHNDLVVSPGKYQVIRKQEYDPFQKVMRQVWD